MTERSDAGRRLVRRLAAELAGDDRRTAGLDVVETGPGDPSPDGTRALTVERGGDPVAGVFVQPTRVYVEFRTRPAVAADAARDAGLRARPGAARPPRALAFVESVEQVDPALDVFAAVREACETATDGTDEGENATDATRESDS